MIGILAACCFTDERIARETGINTTLGAQFLSESSESGALAFGSGCNLLAKLSLPFLASFSH